MLSRLAMAALLVTLAAGSAGAQTAATLLSGQASDNVKPLVGAGVYKRLHDFGYYLNGGVSMNRTDPYYADLTPTTYPTDTIADRFGTGYFLNIGASLPVGSMVTLYGGVGVAGVAGVAEMNETSPKLSSDGTYYVPDSQADAAGTNYNAGVLISAGKVVLEAGYNSYFDTTYLGLGFGF